jgi:hypothetical protein
VLDSHDPLAADADAAGQIGLVEAEVAALLADDQPEV